MKSVVYILRLCLGASICGALAGILGGALIGVGSGLILRNAALGLDGAFWGGVAGVVVGGIYGLALAVADAARKTDAAPSASEAAPIESAVNERTESTSADRTASSNPQDVAASRPVRAGH